MLFCNPFSLTHSLIQYIYNLFIHSSSPPLSNCNLRQLSSSQISGPTLIQCSTQLTKINMYCVTTQFSTHFCGHNILVLAFECYHLYIGFIKNLYKFEEI